MRHPLLALLCAFLTLPGLVVSATAGSPGSETAANSSGAGQLRVAVLDNGGWREVGALAFGALPTEQALDLGHVLRPGPVSVRVSHEGTTTANIDAVLLDGVCPVEVDGAAEPGALAVAKVARRDHDLIDARGRTLTFVFDNAPEEPRLLVTARIEPTRISRVPFNYPVEDSYAEITPSSAFYSYSLDSRPGRLTVDGDLGDDELGEPFFTAYSVPGTGHPAGTTYGWVRNDETTLYVALDFVPDNTMDGDADYARVYVNTASGVRRFEVSEPEQHWGKPGFAYTPRAGYQHKVYEFGIPLDQLLAGPHKAGAPLELAFAAYGTAAPITSSVHGFAWNDLNGNGVLDGGEPPLTSVLFNLDGLDVTGALVSLTTLTDPTGQFHFIDIPPSGPGGYTVTETVPAAGFVPTTPPIFITPPLPPGIEMVWAPGAANLPPGDPHVELLIGPPLMFGNRQTLDIQLTKTESTDPVTAGSGAGNLTYVVTATNNGPIAASGVAVTEVLTLPAGVTVASVTPSAGTSWSSPTWTVPNLGNGASATLTVVLTVGPATAPGTDVVGDTATVSAVNEPDRDSANDSVTQTTSVSAPTNTTATKVVLDGEPVRGTLVRYQVVLTNSGPANQADGPEDEFIDVLPPELELVGASASAPTVAATPATNTVTWNGPIAAGGSVTIEYWATVSTTASVGTIIVNQGTVRYDPDGDGSNDATRPSDDPTVPGPADPTVLGALEARIPTLGRSGVALIVLLVAAAGAVILRKLRVT